MAATGCIEPIYIQDISSGMTEWLPYHLERMTGFTPQDFPTQVLRRIGRMMAISIDNFRVQTRSYVDRPRPVYASTALQIGLLQNINVPELVPYLLPKPHSAHSARYLPHPLNNPSQP